MSTTLLEKHAEKWQPEPNSGCYLWLGATVGKGTKTFPYVRVGGKQHRFHVLVCNEIKGPLPSGLHRSHTCHNRMCVNPDHIVYETQSENEMRNPPEMRRRCATIAGAAGNVAIRKAYNGGK